MKRLSAVVGITGVLATAGCDQAPAASADHLPVSLVERSQMAAAAPLDEPGFRAGEQGLNPAERIGREIWFKATAGNGRFHTYVFQQRMGVLIDWYRVLGGPGREERFKTFGLINDPGCCTPGSAACPARSMEETFGFDWCPGDDQLIKFVGKPGYRDPACDLPDVDGRKDRQDPCDLAFGTSTGALGFRKFPNPRFDAERWRALNGGKLGTWEGYRRRLSDRADLSDSRVNHLADGSVEPPYLVGMACGACHIAFDPLSPPKDPAHPEWKNIKGLIGNQYIRPSELMASGMAADSPEWQIFSHARPGTVDTSAVPNDQVHNPGTMNAIINFRQRPVFAGEKILKWRQVQNCRAGETEDSCWCEPGQPGKCWLKSLRSDDPEIRYILKGGEDSIGSREAIQRVYVNIGMCAETCWVNHLTDPRQLDPRQRNFGQTPFDIGQCRRDCPNFRAIEDRLPELASFFLSSEAGPADLAVARDPDPSRPLAVKRRNLVTQLEKEFGRGAVERGRAVFATSCARCHSSQGEPFVNRDFLQDASDGRMRLDFAGDDRPTPATEVGTYACRALHSNHMKGHLWEEYASDTYHQRPPDRNLPDRSGGGRGYYRNISLLNVWAHAPFMHNNAIGPELCGKPSGPENDFYRTPYVDDTGHLLRDPPPCVPYDPSVEGRFALFKASMDSLLNPDQRIAKMSVLDRPIRLDVRPRTWEGNREKRLAGLSVEFPPGTPASFFGSFQHKQLVVDLVDARTDPAKLRLKLRSELKDEAAAEAAARQLADLAEDLAKNPAQFVELARRRLPLLEKLYLSCRAEVENVGHRFGSNLSPENKKALTAFLATL